MWRKRNAADLDKWTRLEYVTTNPCRVLATGKSISSCVGIRVGQTDWPITMPSTRSDVTEKLRGAWRVHQFLRNRFRVNNEKYPSKPQPTGVVTIGCEQCDCSWHVNVVLTIHEKHKSEFPTTSPSNSYCGRPIYAMLWFSKKYVRHNR
jgi:hypothetical protein